MQRACHQLLRQQGGGWGGGGGGEVGVTLRACMRVMALKERSSQVRQVKGVRPSMLVSSLKVSTRDLSPTAPSKPCTSSTII